MTRLIPDMNLRQTARVLGAAQTLVGVVTLVFPARLGRAVSGGQPTPPEFVVRVLGTRQIAQGLVILANPTRTTIAVAAGVDATHAASLVPLVAFSRRYRRAAAVSALAATTAAVLEGRAAQA